LLLVTLTRAVVLFSPWEGRKSEKQDVVQNVNVYDENHSFTILLIEKLTCVHPIPSGTMYKQIKMEEVTSSSM